MGGHPRLVWPNALPPGTRVGHWRILEREAVGGFGVVYRVEDTRPEAEGGVPGLCALKLALDVGESARRAIREAELLERVRHPNVVGLIEKGRWPDTPDGLAFVVMPYVKGPRLYVWAEECNPRVVEVVTLFRQLAGALRAVHEAGVMHRDVKGDNVLVREEDGQPVLVDFGAGVSEEVTALTQGGLPPGTSAYRSPEALGFRFADHGDAEVHYAFGPADEVYALGVTFYRVLTDVYPFEEEGSSAFVHARMQGRMPPSPAVLNPGVPPALGELVLRMLAHRPEERPASAREVDEALGALELDAEAYLFQWEGRSMRSWTTEPALVWSQMGPEVQRRQEEWRRKHTLRMRPLPTRPVPLTPLESVPGQEAGASESGEPRGEARRSSGRAWGVALLVLGIGVSLLLGLAATRAWETSTETLASGAVSPEVAREASFSEPVVISAPVALEESPNEERAPMKTPKSPQADAPKTSSPKVDTKLMEKCTAAMSAGVFLTACAGVPVKPERLECSSEARKMMKRLHVSTGDEGEAYGHFDQPGWASEMTSYREGPIVSRVDGFYSLDGKALLPKGTLLYGWLWARGEKVHGRYTRAKGPSGEEFPVCLVIGDAATWTWRKEGVSEAGEDVWLMSKVLPFFVVYSFDQDKFDFSRYP